MIAGFITVIVLIEAPIFVSVLTPVLNCPQSSSRHAWREHGVITPLAPLRRDRETETTGDGAASAQFLTTTTTSTATTVYPI